MGQQRGRWVGIQIFWHSGKWIEDTVGRVQQLTSCCSSPAMLEVKNHSGVPSAAFAEWSLSHCSARLPGLRVATKAKANIKCRNLYPLPFRGIESFFEKIKYPWICPLQILIYKTGQGGLSFCLRYLYFPWKWGPYIPLVKKKIYYIPWIGKNVDFPSPPHRKPFPSSYKRNIDGKQQHMGFIYTHFP